MIKVKLNENNARAMAELAVLGLTNAKKTIRLHFDTCNKEFVSDMKIYRQKKSALIDCLERLEFNDLIKEIE